MARAARRAADEAVLLLLEQARDRRASWTQRRRACLDLLQLAYGVGGAFRFFTVRQPCAQARLRCRSDLALYQRQGTDAAQMRRSGRGLPRCSSAQAVRHLAGAELLVRCQQAGDGGQHRLRRAHVVQQYPGAVGRLGAGLVRLGGIEGGAMLGSFTSSAATSRAARNSAV